MKHNTDALWSLEDEELDEDTPAFASVPGITIKQLQKKKTIPIGNPVVPLNTNIRTERPMFAKSKTVPSNTKVALNNKQMTDKQHGHTKRKPTQPEAKKPKYK